VNYQDIKLGEGITIHKIDTVLSFGAPFQLFTYRAGYLAMNAALEAADLNFAFGDAAQGSQLPLHPEQRHFLAFTRKRYSPISYGR
jgi:hypothetical protein